MAQPRRVNFSCLQSQNKAFPLYPPCPLPAPYSYHAFHFSLIRNWRTKRRMREMWREDGEMEAGGNQDGRTGERVFSLVLIPTSFGLCHALAL